MGVTSSKSPVPAPVVALLKSYTADGDAAEATVTVVSDVPALKLPETVTEVAPELAPAKTVTVVPGETAAWVPPVSMTFNVSPAKTAAPREVVRVYVPFAFAAMAVTPTEVNCVGVFFVNVVLDAKLPDDVASTTSTATPAENVSPFTGCTFVAYIAPLPKSAVAPW